MRLALACALALAARAALAHDAPSGMHYDAQCCAEQDCRPVACEQITAVPNGFNYQDPYDRSIFFFTRDKMRLSQDDQCHVCLHGSIIHAPMCLYLPVHASDARDR
jgi:hypothetical protein